MPTVEPVSAGIVAHGSAWEVFLVFLRLGFTSFGGPIAHLGYFRQELVVRRQWLDEATYADVVGLCQALPGPSSSQVGLALGMLRGGLRGALAAWLGFTLPSASAMILVAYGIGGLPALAGSRGLHAVLVIAVAVVAQAVWGMATSLCPDRPRQALALLAAITMLLLPGNLTQVTIIIAAAAIGWSLLRDPVAPLAAPLHIAVPRWIAIGSLALFIVLLAGLPISQHFWPSYPLALVDGFFRAGSLVFGGGHVVLPLLQQVVIPPGWLSNDQFLTGYVAAQALPGPLFSFAAYLGAASNQSPNGWMGGMIALIAIYLPSMLLVLGLMPFWNSLRQYTAVRDGLRGINAAVVGILLAALYQPIWTSAIHVPLDLALALGAFLLLVIVRWPAWAIILLYVSGSVVIDFFP